MRQIYLQTKVLQPKALVLSLHLNQAVVPKFEDLSILVSSLCTHGAH